MIVHVHVHVHVYTIYMTVYTLALYTCSCTICSEPLWPRGALSTHCCDITVMPHDIPETFAFSDMLI